MVEETGMGLRAVWGIGGCGPAGGPWVAMSIIGGWVGAGWWDGTIPDCIWAWEQEKEHKCE